jgi:hypothetical protein
VDLFYRLGLTKFCNFFLAIIGEKQTAELFLGEAIDLLTA